MELAHKRHHRPSIQMLTGMLIPVIQEIQCTIQKNTPKVIARGKPMTCIYPLHSVHEVPL
jgi:hypothetical protein